MLVNSTGGVVDDGKLRRRFRAALDRAGAERLRFHDLRHTFGTLAVQAFPLTDVKAYMGHADLSTTMIYVHHVPRHDAADRLGRLLDEAGAPGARRGACSGPCSDLSRSEATSAGAAPLRRAERACRPTDSEFS
ncbi:MAG: hypothetical protein QOD71_3233 [Thermoleophilaceae bacterium]|nr:hypothetical protein [Thermoleophilaceae bacterium]